MVYIIPKRCYRVYANAVFKDHNSKIGSACDTETHIKIENRNNSNLF